MKKLLLTLLLTLSSAVAFAFTGSGTSSDPYLIKTADDLYSVRNYLGSHFKLVNDIDLTEWIADNSPVSGWAPISSSYGSFYGTFDGNGFTISGLYINRTTSGNGLFGRGGTSSERADIKNLHVICDITGGARTGAIIGDNLFSTITNCTVEGKIKGTEYVGGLAGYLTECTVTNCVNFSYVEGVTYTGGLIGYCTGGLISQCANENEVKGSSQFVGGLVGCWQQRDDSRILNCYAKGDVYGGSSEYVGGLVGYSNSNSNVLSDCYYEGNVISTGYYVGGIIGYSYSKVDRCLAKGTVSGEKYVGGIAGSQNGGHIYSCVCICSKITSNYGNYCGRICYNGPLGSLGTTTENKVTNECKVYNGETLQNIVDDSYQGFSASDYALRRAISYTAIGWNLAGVWAIDEGESYPYLRFRQPTGNSVIKDEKAAFNFTLPAELTPAVTPSDEEDSGVNITTKTFTNNDVAVSFSLGTRTQTFSARLWTNDDMSNCLRAYKDGTMTIATSPYNLITRIAFAGEDVSSMTADCGSISGGVWTGEAQSVTFTIGASYNKINTIDVTYKHDVLALTDVAPEVLAGSYEPGKVIYSRVSAGNYASFCLPFDVDLGAATGIEKVYMPMEQILYNTQTEYLMMFLKEQSMSSTVKAGTPFLAKIADADVSFSNAKRVSFSMPFTDNPAEKALTVFDFDGMSGVLYENNTLNVSWGGTYVGTEAVEGLNSFNINGSFGQHTGTLSPYRAYVMQTAKSGNSNVRGIQLNLGDDEGEVTRVFQLLGEPGAAESIYDMQGRRVFSAQQGGLYIINGKKVRL